MCCLCVFVGFRNLKLLRFSDLRLVFKVKRVERKEREREKDGEIG